MKTPEQRGRFGAWLVEQRKRRSVERGKKLRQEDVTRELAESGFPIDPAYYRALEGGSKRPGRDTRQALADYFGAEPPPDGQGEPQDISALVVALREQVATNRDLTDAIREMVGVLQSAALRGIAQAQAQFEEEEGDQPSGTSLDTPPGAPSPGTPP